MNFPPVDPATWSEARSLIRAFAAGCLDDALASRWCELIDSGRPKSWSKIDPWSLWNESAWKPGAIHRELREQVKEFGALTDPPLRPQERVFFFALGHSTPGLAVAACADVTPDHWPLEGLALIGGRSEAFAMNHDGNWMLCHPAAGTAR